MKKFRSVFVWMWLLTKRLYKKPAFLALLLIIPLVIFAYSFIAQDESGMMTIVIALEDPEDTISVQLADELADSSGIIRFLEENEPATAIELVNDGVADAAWIIPRDIGMQIRDFISDSYNGNGFVRVVVREETIPLMLANEKLSGKLFVQCARTSYLQYMRQELPEILSLSDEKILEYFDRVELDNDLFEYSYLNGATVQTNAKNYLLMPVRGLLAILAVIASLAIAMFYIKDEREGLFSWVSNLKRSWIELGYQIIAIGNVMLFIIIALVMANLNVSILREILCGALYIMSCAVFGQLLRLLFKNQHIIAMILPFLIVIMIVVCPVFISLPGFTYIQYLFPVSYYLYAIYDAQYILYMLIYTISLWVLYKLSSRLLKRF